MEDEIWGAFLVFIFFLRLVTYLPTLLSRLLNEYFHINEWFIFGTLFSVLSLFTSFAKPYKKPYMNYLDAMLHLHYGILCFVLSTGQQIIIARVLLWTPFTLLFLIISTIIFKKLQVAILKILKVCSKLNWHHQRFRGITLTTEPSNNQRVSVCGQTVVKPLIQPTSTVFNYGAINDNAILAIAD